MSEDADMLRDVRAMRQRIKRVADQISRAEDWHDTDPVERKHVLTELAEMDLVLKDIEKDIFN